MVYFVFYRDEIDKIMIVFEFFLIELFSILNFIKFWVFMKMINLSIDCFIYLINI